MITDFGWIHFAYLIGAAFVASLLLQWADRNSYRP